MQLRAAVLLLLAVECCLGTGSSVCAAENSVDVDWPYYHADPGGTHYSRLRNINTRNVGKLQRVWTYETSEAAAEHLRSNVQSHPLIVGGRLFFISPTGRLISLDAETGREHWQFDPAGGASVRAPQWLRGVSYWTDGTERRILFTFMHDLYAVDADTGRPCRGFGADGHVALSTGIDRDRHSIVVKNRTPGVVYKDIIIMGGTGDAPGDIRAFDVRTGSLRWIFHTIPHPGETGYETWPKDAWTRASGANNWAGMALDAQRALVFVPLAAASGVVKDFYGADRLGHNLFANSLVALQADTGRLVWFFQTVRHDVWDRDLPAPPTLVSVVRKGKRVAAVAQITKSGFVYVLDRQTGKSLFPLVEQPAWASDIPGEVTAATQIQPQLPEPFARQHLTPDLLTRRTPQATAAVTAQFSALRSRGLWDPPSEQGTILFPGLDGGGLWGGAAYDLQSGLLYVNATEMPWILKLKKRSASGDLSAGALYQHHCAACHGKDRAGQSPEFPSLLNIGERLPADAIAAVIRTGSGRMPAFASRLDNEQITALSMHLRTGDDIPLPSKSSRTQADAYVLESASPFLDPDRYPAVSPPWGTLNAIDLSSGRYVWKIPFGEYPELAAQGIAHTGSGNVGGAIVTAGGLLFIGATTRDKKFRAYDKRNGKLLWETVLPAAATATPATYRVNGRQFVVVTVGNAERGPPGAKVIAFALAD